MAQQRFIGPDLQVEQVVVGLLVGTAGGRRNGRERLAGGGVARQAPTLAAAVDDELAGVVEPAREREVGMLCACQAAVRRWAVPPPEPSCEPGGSEVTKVSRNRPAKCWSNAVQAASGSETSRSIGCGRTVAGLQDALSVMGADHRGGEGVCQAWGREIPFHGAVVCVISNAMHEAANKSASGRYVISVLVKDKVGILRGVSAAVTDLGGNIDGVSQTVLEGYFTVILTATFAGPCREDHLREAVREALADEDAALVIQPFESSADGRTHPAQGSRYMVTLNGGRRRYSEGRDRFSGRHGRERGRLVSVCGRNAVTHLGEVTVPALLDIKQLQDGLRQVAGWHGFARGMQHENIFRVTNEVGAVRPLLEETTSCIKIRDLLATVRMLQEENLDVRTVTMGIHLGDCARPGRKRRPRPWIAEDPGTAGNLVRVCDELSTRYGLPDRQQAPGRLAGQPLLEGHDRADAAAPGAGPGPRGGGRAGRPDRRLHRAGAEGHDARRAT